MDVGEASCGVLGVISGDLDYPNVFSATVLHASQFTPLQPRVVSKSTN